MSTVLDRVDADPVTAVRLAVRRRLLEIAGLLWRSKLEVKVRTELNVNPTPTRRS